MACLHDCHQFYDDRRTLAYYGNSQSQGAWTVTPREMETAGVAYCSKAVICYHPLRSIYFTTIHQACLPVATRMKTYSHLPRACLLSQPPYDSTKDVDCIDACTEMPMWGIHGFFLAGKDCISALQNPHPAIVRCCLFQRAHVLFSLTMWGITHGGPFWVISSCRHSLYSIVVQMFRGR